MIKLSSLLIFNHFFQNLILNMKKRSNVFIIFFFSFCMSSSLVIMPLKQLPISTELGVKDPLVIGQYGADFRTSLVKVQILKIKTIETHDQLNEIWPANFTSWYCLTTCCQDDTAEAHWLGIREFARPTIFSRFLTYRLPFKRSTSFYAQKNISFLRSRHCI